MVGKDGNKTEKVLALWDRLMDGDKVTRPEVVELFGVNDRTASRYLAEIRKHLLHKEEEDGIKRFLVFDPAEGIYKIVGAESHFVSESELYAVCKILLSSRAFSKKEMGRLLDRLLRSAVSPEEKKDLEEYIKNEIGDYRDPDHVDPDVDALSLAARAVRSRHVLLFDYKKPGERQTRPHRIYPLGIVFSEYYFYLIGDPCEFGEIDRKNRRIYRLDRMCRVKMDDETFSVPYSDRFREGDFKNSTQFMYGGRRQQIGFLYRGPSPEAVLDLLPISTAVLQNDGSYLIKSEVDGLQGVLMWLLSQGSKVNVLYPQELRDSWLHEAQEICRMGESQTK